MRIEEVLLEFTKGTIDHVVTNLTQQAKRLPIAHVPSEGRNR